MTAATVHLGYELGTAKPIAVPIRHMAVTGQTQESGKTTTLEALVTRSGTTALTFVTKRGEGSFAGGRRIAPYFRDRADWQFVSSILDATLQEKNKFLRPWIMKICRATKTLAEVQQKVREALRTAKGINEGVYTQLDAYLDLIVPEIKRAHLAPTLDLVPGLNVMDVSSFATPMQMLFIQSALDWVNEHCRKTIVVIPEAWEFVPEGKGSPVKASAITLVRKGAGIGNQIWVDSQDMAGVDKTILRGCAVWLIGVQREANEIKRNLGNIPASIKRPTPADVAMLERGQFYACWGQHCVKVYVQPAWMVADDAIAIAKGAASVDRVTPPAPKQEEEVSPAEAHALQEANSRLTTQVDEFQRRVTSLQAQLEDAQARAAQLGFDQAKQGILALISTVTMFDNPALTSAAPPPTTRRVSTDQQPAAQAPAARPPKASEPSGLTQAGLTMLGALVRSHPQPLDARLWAVAIGKSPESGKAGPWYRERNNLVAAGFIEEAGSGFCATKAGIVASGQVPAKPENEVALFALWRDEIAATVGDAAMTMLRVLARHRNHRLSSEQWALLSGKSPASGKAGPWYSAVKALREWGLLSGDGRFSITAKGCAVIVDLPAPAPDTAELLRLARRTLLKSSQRHYDALTKPMRRNELADALGVSAQSAKAGPWYGAIKEMIECGLVVDEAGILRRADETLEAA